jgi:CRISPR type III-A-associated protein Csm2
MEDKMYENKQYQGNQRPQAPAFDFTGKPFFQDGKVNLSWVSEYARELSKILSENGLTSTQLRNFYNEFLRIRNMPETAVEEKKVHIRMLAAKVEYKRTTNRLTSVYVKFVNELIKEVNDDLNKFADACHIMEALVAYNPKSK